MLIVEDQDDAAALLKMLFEAHGDEAVHVYSAEAALEIVGSLAPEAIVLDLSLPGMNGFEAAGKFREALDGRQCNIVAVSGWGREEDQARSRRAGIDHHLVKPADFGELRSLLLSTGPAANKCRQG